MNADMLALLELPAAALVEAGSARAPAGAVTVLVAVGSGIGWDLPVSAGQDGRQSRWRHLGPAPRKRSILQ